MIDWSRVDELRDEIGAEDLAEVLEMFLDEVETKLTEIFEAANFNTLSEDMHFVKSSAMNIGFRRLASLCADAEVQARKAPDTVDMSSIRECYQVSKSELEQGQATRAA